MLRKFTNRFLAGLAVATTAAILSPTSAKSQQAAAPSQTPVTTTAPATEQTTGGGELEKVTVTGYILPHVGDGPQPVTSYDQNYMSKTGYQSTTDILQNLPGAAGNWNPGVTTGFGFSPGSASIALKGLPPFDTLTLVDGLRYPLSPFPQESLQGVFSFVDINNIPAPAVDHIDILNDGGSATYGSDAVAGVVNINTKHDYNGAEITNYYGISQRGDDEVYHGSAVGGYTLKPSDTSNINVTAAIDFYDSSPIMQDDRPWTQENSNKLAAAYPGHPNWLKIYDSFLIDRTEELSSYENQGVYPPSTFNHGGVVVPANNPYNPFGVPLTVIDMNLAEFGPLQEDATITTLRNVVGATVQLPFGAV